MVSRTMSRDEILEIVISKIANDFPGVELHITTDVWCPFLEYSFKSKSSGNMIEITYQEANRISELYECEHVPTTYCLEELQGLVEDMGDLGGNFALVKIEVNDVVVFEANADSVEVFDVEYFKK